jgi:hypothetical protein
MIFDMIIGGIDKPSFCDAGLFYDKSKIGNSLNNRLFFFI